MTPERAQEILREADDALLAWLKANDYPETTADDIEASPYDADTFAAHGNEYLVLDDEDANKRAYDYITSSLWAFNASFLASETGLPEEVFTALQNKCEDANDTIEQLIETNGSAGPQMTSMECFVKTAIAADGRGHFIGFYDGEEHESITKTYDAHGDWDGNVTFYIYRVN